MAAGKFNPLEAGYIPVNERIMAFKAEHPEGSLQSEIVELNDNLVVIRGYAYRTADDLRPGIGHSQMAIPGPTSFTKGSEIENAETSAWGRAIAALGFEVKSGIASAEEVAMKAGDPTTAGASTASSSGTAAPTTVGPSVAKKNKWLKDARKVFNNDEEIKAFATEVTGKESSAGWTDADLDHLHAALVDEQLDRMGAATEAEIVAEGDE